MPSLPRLSVVMFTDGPMAMVAATLRQVREVAHEIVVAVDDRVPVADLGEVVQVADRVIRAEFVHPLEANLDWLHRQATGDWILRLDSDDVVSAALARRLRTPGWDDGITHAYLQYRWLWGDPGTTIDQAPWWPDPVLRLIRNLPGIARFDHGAHQVPRVAGAPQFWDESLYHLDLLVSSAEQRAAKAAAYELDAPGHRTDRGWAVSATYYRPEALTPPPRTSPTPPVDAAVIAQVLQARDSRAQPPKVDPGRVSGPVRAVDRGPVPPAPGDARLRLLAHEPITVIAPRTTQVTVGVTNLGARTWHPDDDPPHQLGARMVDAAGAPVGPELRGGFDGPVPVGGEVLGRLSVPGDLPPTAAALQVGIVQDGVAWHDATETIGLRQQRGRRLLVSTGVSTFSHLGDDLITQEILAAVATDLPDVVPTLLAHPTAGLDERFGCEVADGPAALPGSAGRGGDGARRIRELVSQARLMAKGDTPTDPTVAELLQPFAQASALVIAPGGGLASRYSREALGVYAVQAQIAHAFGIPILVEAASIGPIEVRRDHAALAQLLNEATVVTTRDSGSADAARRIGRSIDPDVVPDVATAAVDRLGAGRARARRWLRDHGVDPGHPYAVVSLRAGTRDHEQWPTVDAALGALDAGTPIVFVPHCDTPGIVDDRDVLDARHQTEPGVLVWDGGSGDRAAVALVAGATLAVGTRFHLCVLAAAAGVPVVALVADEYDRIRTRAVAPSSGVRVVALKDAPAAGEAARDLLASPRPPRAGHWDPHRFTATLDAHLPRAPRLL